jgi:hypothetical protein
MGGKGKQRSGSSSGSGSGSLGRRGSPSLEQLAEGFDDPQRRRSTKSNAGPKLRLGDPVDLGLQQAYGADERATRRKRIG